MLLKKLHVTHGSYYSKTIGDPTPSQASRSGQPLAQDSGRFILSGPYSAHLFNQITGLEHFRNLKSYHSFETTYTLM